MPQESETGARGGEPPHAHQAKWQAWAVALVILGCLATAGYAVVENFWG